MEQIGPFPYDPDHHALFRTGTLMRAWARAYPHLFRAQDVRNAAAQRKNHYYEWLAAILLYHTRGYLSLLKYEFPTASREKSAIVRRLLGNETCDWLHARQKRRVVQCPDLLVFTPDYSDAWFCEVKGPTDTLRRPQENFFAQLTARTQKPVRVLSFK